MVTIPLHCPHCQSETLVRNGHAPNGKQLYRCQTGGRQSRENPTPNHYPQARREEILHASSRTQQLAWPDAYVWCLSHNGLQLEEKNVAQLPPLSTTLVALKPEKAASTVLERDELWSCVLKKAHECGVWMAFCRQTRQGVASALGDLAAQTCLRFWQSIP